MSTRIETPHLATHVTESAPASGWRRAFRDWSLVGGATAVCQALGVVTALALRMILDPAQMGIWQALRLFWSYGAYANLGISKGAAREFTVAGGRGDTTQAERGLNLAFTVNTLTSLLYAVMLAAAGVWVASAGGTWSGPWALGLFAVGGLAVVGRYVTFHVTILRCEQDFATCSQLSIVEAGLTLVVCVTATWLWGLTGLCFGTLGVLFGSLIFVWRRRAVDLAWAWDAGHIRRLISIGGPILLAATAGTLLRSLDKLMILGYLSDREFQLGCYSVAVMVTVQLYGLGNMLSIVMGPRYGETFGRSGDRGQVAQLAARATELQALIMALPAGLAVVASAAVLGRLLPDYSTGLAPIVWLVPGVVALTLSLPSSQYLVAVNRQGRALVAVLIAIPVAALGNHLALSAGLGLVGVAGATALAYTVYFLLTARVSIWSELDRSDRARCLTLLAVSLLPTLATATALETSFPGTDAPWSVTLAKIVTVTLVWTIGARVAWRRGRWSSAFGKPFNPFHHSGSD